MTDRLTKMLQHVQGLEHWWYNEGRKQFRRGLRCLATRAPAAYRDSYVRGYIDEMSKPTAPVTLLQRIRNWVFGAAHEA